VNPSSDRLDRIELAIEKLTERHLALTERHEALTLRHEALTMNLELTARDLEVMKQGMDQMVVNSLKLHESIKSLEVVALAHEQRLDDLEER